MSRKIKIKRQFDEHGREIARYIGKDSVQNAQKFINEVDKLTDKIEQNPKAFPPEPYLPTENNLYRFAIVMKSWKIIFKTSSKFRHHDLSQSALSFFSYFH
jgi:plasmid stabilization system protein ParE